MNTDLHPAQGVVYKNTDSKTVSLFIGKATVEWNGRVEESLEMLLLKGKTPKRYNVVAPYFYQFFEVAGDSDPDTSILPFETSYLLRKLAKLHNVGQIDPFVKWLEHVTHSGNFDTEIWKFINVPQKSHR